MKLIAVMSMEEEAGAILSILQKASVPVLRNAYSRLMHLYYPLKVHH